MIRTGIGIIASIRRIVIRIVVFNERKVRSRSAETSSSTPCIQYALSSDTSTTIRPTTDLSHIGDNTFERIAIEPRTVGDSGF